LGSAFGVEGRTDFACRPKDGNLTLARFSRGNVGTGISSTNPETIGCNSVQATLIIAVAQLRGIKLVAAATDGAPATSRAVIGQIQGTTLLLTAPRQIYL
jgi:hypothetical protein